MEELFVRAKADEYRKIPERWLVERFDGSLTDLHWSSFPEYKNHIWDGTKDPFLVAINSIRDGQDVGIEAATGVGKTYIAARIAYWFLDSFPNSAVITTSPTKEQLLQVLWKEIAMGFQIFKSRKPNAELLTGDLRVNKDLEYGDEAAMIYTNRMTSKVGRKRAGEETNVSFQGIHNVFQLFILDEAAGLEPSIITSIKNTNTFKGQLVYIDGSGKLVPAGTTGARGVRAINVILALGNPDSVTDGLHQFCKSPGVKHIRVSAYDHPNVVLGSGLIPGAVTRESLELRKREYGEGSNLFRSRGRGIAPEQANDALIMRKWFDQCCRFKPDWDVPMHEGGPTPAQRFKDDMTCYNAVGVDVANSLNGDGAALAWGRSNRLVDLHEFQCPDANALADNLVKSDDVLLAEGIRSYGTKKVGSMGVTADFIGVDSAGLGVATVNQFSRLQYIVKALSGGVDDDAIPREPRKNMKDEPKPLYSFANLRAQMWFQLRIDLMNVDFCIDITNMALLELLAEELTSVKYEVKDKHIIIEKKEDIKSRIGGKSPNKADALVYWNWVRKIRSGKHYTGIMPMAAGSGNITDTNAKQSSGIPPVGQSGSILPIA